MFTNSVQAKFTKKPDTKYFIMFYGKKSGMSEILLQETRVTDAVRTFESGFNCAQSVFSTYADLFGIDRETALKMASGLGAGIGRMREVCGPVSAMAMLAGLKEGNADPNDEQAKARIYSLVRQMARRFREEKGSIICRELLGIEGPEESAAPSARTPAYYASRPCSGLVECAAGIIEEMLLSDKPSGDTP